jgi:hypothetical protein
LGSALHFLCATIHQAVLARAARSRIKLQNEHQAVSAFVCLRVFCPAICNPVLFGILSGERPIIPKTILLISLLHTDAPDAEMSRSLVQISKLLTQLSNGGMVARLFAARANVLEVAPFDKPEFANLNPFVESQHAVLNAFFAALSVRCHADKPVLIHI